MKKVHDTFLLLQLKTKDPTVFGRFYDAYIGRIHRFIYFKVSSKEEAEDLTAETFLKVWQHLFENKKIDNLNAFVYQVARNLVIDHYRKRSQQRLFVDNLATDEDIAAIPDPNQPNIEEQLQVLSDMVLVEKYLRRLKDEYREAIILRYIDELSVSEMSKILDKSKGTVRVLCHRALHALKAIIEQGEPHART